MTQIKRLCFLSSLLLIGLICLSSCQYTKRTLEPSIVYNPPIAIIEHRPSAFALLTPKECQQDWGKELRIAYAFTQEMDFYRAITSYKRALVLLPQKELNRRMQIEYDIMQSYYFALKYADVVQTFEAGEIKLSITPEFPAYRDLLIILSDSYEHIGECEKAKRIRCMLEELEPETVERLGVSYAIRGGDLAAVESHRNIDSQGFLQGYYSQAKSVTKARTLNAILPGAGYWYVGQKQSAVTSFVINALFIAAAAHFFADHNIPAGLILASLEYGWYAGGINGAGLAAKEYNERIYECAAKEFMVQERLFPVLMLNYSF